MKTKEIRFGTSPGISAIDFRGGNPGRYKISCRLPGVNGNPSGKTISVLVEVPAHRQQASGHTILVSNGIVIRT